MLEKIKAILKSNLSEDDKALKLRNLITLKSISEVSKDKRNEAKQKLLIKILKQTEEFKTASDKELIAIINGN